MLDTPRIKVAQTPRAHPDKALTAVHVRNIKKPGKYCDGNGLYLVVDPSGAKRWLLRTVILGKRCDLGLGSVRLVTLAEARDEALRIRRKARDGEDPLADRRRASLVVPTFKEAAERVHAAHAATFKNEKHKAQWLASLKTDVFPVIGTCACRRFNQGRAQGAVAYLDDEARNGAPAEAADESRIRLGRGVRFPNGDNPTDGITRVLPNVRKAATHHPALPYAQVPAFVQQLRECDAGEVDATRLRVLDSDGGPHQRGHRRTVGRNRRGGRTWTIPGVRIKAGREHRVPLSARCLELLKRAKAALRRQPVLISGSRAWTSALQYGVSDATPPA